MGGDRPGVQDAIGTPVAGSLRIARAWIAGMPSALFVANPRTHLIADEIVGRVRAAQMAGMACAKESAGRGRDADLRRQLRGPRRSARIVRSASRSRSSTGGMLASTDAPSR